MSNPQKQYAYKYDTDSDIGTWMSAQKNKTRSIGYLIQWAVKKFGEQDLIDASVQELLSPSSTPVLQQNQSSVNKTSVANAEPSNSANSANRDKTATTLSPPQAIEKTNQPGILANMLK